jgi:hypothetical protein
MRGVSLSDVCALFKCVCAFSMCVRCQWREDLERILRPAPFNPFLLRGLSSPELSDVLLEGARPLRMLCVRLKRLADHAQLRSMLTSQQNQLCLPLTAVGVVANDGDFAADCDWLIVCCCAAC